MTMPAIGTPAPDFTLPSTSGTTVSLADFRGRKQVLLAFFPLAFTGTCTAQMCEFSEDYARYEGQDTVVLPISVDSIPTLKIFKEREHLKVDLYSDFKREVSRAFGVLHEELFFAKRAYILIDKDGLVRWTYEEAQLGEKRGTDELLAQLEAVG